MDSNIRTVKVKLGEDLRRFPYTDDLASLPSLIARIESIFGPALQAPWRLAWTDEDGDIVNIRHPADLFGALQAVSDGTLRLIVLPDTPSSTGDKPKSVPQPAAGPEQAKPQEQPQPQQSQQQQRPTLPSLFENLASQFGQVFEQIREEHEAQERAEQEANAQPTPEVEHTGVTCDTCQATPIVGTRFKCTSCWNFDICARCEARGLHANHVLLRIRKPDTLSSRADGFRAFAGRCGAGACPRWRQWQEQQPEAGSAGGCGRARFVHPSQSQPQPQREEERQAPLDPTRWDRELNLLSEMGIAVDPDTLRRLLDSHQGVIAGVLSEIFRTGLNEAK